MIVLPKFDYLQKGEKYGAVSTHPAFYGSDGLAYFIPFTDVDRNEQYAEKRIEQGLIDFVELDLSKYRLWLEAEKSITLYYKADIKAKRLKQLAVCLKELERVIEL